MSGVLGGSRAAPPQALETKVGSKAQISYFYTHYHRIVIQLYKAIFKKESLFLLLFISYLFQHVLVYISLGSYALQLRHGPPVEKACCTVM